MSLLKFDNKELMFKVDNKQAQRPVAYRFTEDKPL